MNKLAFYIISAFILLISACAYSPESTQLSSTSGFPNWAKNNQSINRIIALDGTVFYLKYRATYVKIGGLEHSLAVLLNSDGDKITEPAANIIPISKKIGVSCTPKENNFNNCLYWDLARSSPKGTESNLETFYFDKTGSSAPGETRTITSIRLLEYTSGQGTANPTYSLRLINPDLSDKARIDSITTVSDNEKFIKVNYANGSFENFDYTLKSLTDNTNYEMVNGKAVVAVANENKLYLYYNSKLKQVEPLPQNVLGYRPVFNSDKYFSAVIKTPNGLRYMAHLPSGKGASQICKDIQLQTHFNMGPQFHAVLCLNEQSEWTPIEVEDKNAVLSYPNVSPNKDYRQLLVSINSSLQATQSAASIAQQEANCMKLSEYYRNDCFLRAGGYVSASHLRKNPSPDPAFIVQIFTKFYVDPDDKKIITEKLLAGVKSGKNLSSLTVLYVLQNVQLKDTDRKLLSEKWLQIHQAEIEQAKNELRHCIKTANSWASMKERSCAKQLGGEEWYAWLEQDFNASSKDFVEAIAEAKKIGRDTTKLQKTYESVKRSEATTAYYAEVDRREREEKAAFGNIYTIMKNVRENIQAACAQNASYCSGNVSNPIMDSYKMIQWQQSIKNGGPTWDQINSYGR